MRTTVASASPFSPGFRRTEAVRLTCSGSGAAHAFGAGAAPGAGVGAAAAGGGAECEQPNAATPSAAAIVVTVAILANAVNPEPFAHMFGAGSLPAKG